ncbi:MAG: tRNA (pseudouridine(54)-N(1))-methyltransferase TrmY [Halobacteriaceae archaeon]
MRQFVVVGHEAPVTPEFSLDDLPGGAGRLDVLCRVVGAALFLSHGVREDATVWLVLRDELAVRVDGGSVRYMSPDERNIASLLRTAIGAREDAIGHQEAEPTPGLFVSTRGLEAVLDAAGGTVVCLHEDGRPVVDLDPPADPTVVLSDHRSFTDAERDVVDAHADATVRLGPRPLHANHAVTVAHNYLDTGGYATY